MTALAYTLTTVSLSFSAFAAISVSDIMSTCALCYTSSTFFPSDTAFPSYRVSATVSRKASASRSPSDTECVRLRLY